MKLNEYKIGDKVEVLINNPKLNTDTWVDGEVLGRGFILPLKNERHKPYTILTIKLNRIYCKIEPIYNYINDNIPIFVDNKIEFYEMTNIEGFIDDKKVRLKW
jgi:hypothetical protein